MLESAAIAKQPLVAYLSMEIALGPAMATYSGGLGILAGDTLRAAADMGINMVGVTLLHRRGYFRQQLDSEGRQVEGPSLWDPQDYLEPMGARIIVKIESRDVHVQAWRYTIEGQHGHTVTVYLLDTDLPVNGAWDRKLTDHLYGGDDRYRLCQEVVLGIGGVSMLHALGHRITTYHMNEGHSALLTMALLNDLHKLDSLYKVTPEDMEVVRNHCVFTTHTPVPAGMDKFPRSLVSDVLGKDLSTALQRLECFHDGSLNMTHLALMFSRYINGVSMRHEEISRGMFPNYPVNSISNGVHAPTWTSVPYQRLFDRYIPEWRRDNHYLRYAISIPLEEIWQAHIEAKRLLFEEVRKRTDIWLAPHVMTIGFARRATLYKRADLLFADIDRLIRLSKQAGPLQILYGGKAHPRDEEGKAMIRKVFEASAALRDHVKVVYLEDYDMRLAGYICSGVDLWLNTPRKPDEASGTSGMKAALNGVPSFSVLDGWWVEGHFESVTGWSIGDSHDSVEDTAAEVSSLYNKLEYQIVPMFYARWTEYARVMRSAIALNGSFYNAQRMIAQYMINAYTAPARGEA